MFQTFRNAWKIPELKNRLLFTLAILVVYRLGSAIPVPFITGSALNQMFSNGNMLSYLDMMSGGALSRCTLFALGVTPYINASIIVQLLTVAIPALENMAKEADGQQKMQQITRYVGGVIALVMSLGYYFVIRNMGALKYTSGAAGIFTAVVIIATFTAGAQLITWCGEQIDDKGIGNGISLLIFSSIVSNWSSVYTTVTGLLTRAAAGETRFYILLPLLLVLLLPLLTLAAGLLARHLLIPHLMRKNPNNSPQALTAALCCVLAAFNLLTGAMLFSALSSGSFAEPGEAFVRIVNVLMGLMLIPMGNIMPKVKRNGAFGLRTRWSMANDACWNRCQRMGGLSLMVTGALIVLGALLLPPAYSTVLMLLLILLDAVFSTVYSYQVYQKYGRN